MNHITIQDIANFSAIIFDMDGVLVDTEPLHIESFHRYLSQLGIEYPEGFIETFIGYSVEENLQTINRRFLKGREIPITEAVKLRDTHFVELLQNTSLRPAKGFDEIVSRTDIPLALASSSIVEHIDIILSNLSANSATNGNYRKVFQSITGGDEVDEKKPAPDIYLLAAEKLNLRAERCIAIEDSFAGIRSAQAAGLKVIGLRNPYIDEEKLSRADLAIDSLQDIAAYL